MSTASQPRTEGCLVPLPVFFDSDVCGAQADWQYFLVLGVGLVPSLD